MAKRKTALDRAIEQLDQDILAAESAIEVLKAARRRLVQQQQPEQPKIRAHTEGGRGI